MTFEAQLGQLEQRRDRILRLLHDAEDWNWHRELGPLAIYVPTRTIGFLKSMA